MPSCYPSPSGRLRIRAPITYHNEGVWQAALLNSSLVGPIFLLLRTFCPFPVHVQHRGRGGYRSLSISIARSFPPRPWQQRLGRAGRAAPDNPAPGSSRAGGCAASLQATTACRQERHPDHAAAKARLWLRGGDRDEKCPPFRAGIGQCKSQHHHPAYSITSFGFISMFTDLECRHQDRQRSETGSRPRGGSLASTQHKHASRQVTTCRRWAV